MKYADLTPYTYTYGTVPEGVVALNVGWLEDDDCRKGETPAGFVEALGRLCRQHAHARMRGYQSCALKHEDEPADYPVTAEVDGEQLTLGDAEVRVVAENGDWLVAPTLVLHYVAEHGYLPPEPFVEAVLAGRHAPSAS
jgi:hypothetical protein